jgi:FtsP/CotA-like multicopper oxidase with cupredoxin domain
MPTIWLPQSSSMHVASEDDGGPHTMISPDSTWSPAFEVLDEATTFWYHPHLHSKTAEQVYFGAAGMIIVRDPAEAALDLPRTYGVDDFPIIIQDKSFDASNQLIFAALADTMLINGTLAPYLEVPAQRVRFRYLNASSQRAYHLNFPPQFQPLLIGTDGGLLEAPLPINGITLSPGERIEVVLDFSGMNGNTEPMACNNSQLPNGCSGGPGGPGGPPGNNLDANDFNFMEIRVTPANGNPAGATPTVLNTHNIWDEVDADVLRTKVFDTLTTGFPYYINGTAFNMMVVNDTIQLDDIEIWELVNETNIAHPFHIHDIQFYILDINGNPPPPELRGRKDVVLVNVGQTIRFITKFEDFADDVIPYMYHCHNLFHEDAGMMGQFIVIDSTTIGMNETMISAGQLYSAYPNPTTDVVTLERLGSSNGNAMVSVFNTVGKLISSHNMPQNQTRLRLGLSDFDAGLYLISIVDADGTREVLRVVKR